MGYTFLGQVDLLFFPNAISNATIVQHVSWLRIVVSLLAYSMRSGRFSAGKGKIFLVRRLSNASDDIL